MSEAARTLDADSGPFARRYARVQRGLRRRFKLITGQRVRIMIDVRWRLGDEIMAIPIYESLKRKYPNSYIAVCCNHPELLRENPFVDEIVSDSGIVSTTDHFIDLRDASRTTFRRAHYASLADVPTPNTAPRVYWPETALAIEADLPPRDRRVAVSTGASWATKRWPADRWRELCRRLESDGFGLVQIGHGDASIGLRNDLIDKTTVHEAGCVIRNSRLYIGCDSGLMHLALAVGTPAIALFGPTDPAILVDDSAKLTAIRNNRACFGCWNRLDAMREPGVCPLGVSECLGTIEVDAVFNAAHQALSHA